MKILMVAACPFPANRGTPSRILRMAEALADKGYEIHIASYPNKDHTIDVGKNITIHRINPFFRYNKMDPGPSLKKPFLDMFLSIKICTILREHNVDVIHAHHIEGLASSLLASKILKIPVIYDAHTHVTGELEEYGVISNTLIKKISNRLESILIKRATAVISVSEELADVLYSFGFNKDKIWVIPTGTNLEHFQNSKSKSSQKSFKDSSGLSEKNEVIVYAGTLKPYQGLEYLIDAMKIVAQKISTAKLLIVGGGDIEKYKQLVEENDLTDSVLFLGERPFREIPDILSISDVAVLPRTEATGIPQKLTNYMAAGLPIVAFKGSSKILEHRVSGYIVENGHVQEFADGILEILGNSSLSNKLSRNAKNKVEEFTWPKLIKDCEDCYYAVVNK